MANLSLIDPKTRAWFKKKQMMIWSRLLYVDPNSIK
jgi:hypothetical protein